MGLSDAAFCCRDYSNEIPPMVNVNGREWCGNGIVVKQTTWRTGKTGAMHDGVRAGPNETVVHR
jgi:hypothetical protein